MGGEKVATKVKIITVVYLMCSLGHSFMYDFTGKVLCQCLAENEAISHTHFYSVCLVLGCPNTYDPGCLCTV